MKILSPQCILLVILPAGKTNIRINLQEIEQENSES